MVQTNRVVFDAWALIAFLLAERGSEQIRELLEAVRIGEIEGYMSQVNLGEILYRISRDGTDPFEDLTYIDSIGIQFVDADRDSVIAAAWFKARYRMPYADCFAAALARLVGGEVVTGDPHFKLIESEVPVRWVGASG